ncbi:cupin-like domain-containing protein [Gilvimarinus sp. SDUM040013]|uniref:Cupin-like domain-containing protein n=1 Tax=Gilvimarinus gilvus TaxID=3058038 RepID=A0ABU4RSE3_9GAMM|nr:cupin-like domain-containing protein [Gilvimarinus sp. SDUM040013]MDO3388264.1 cupin-like domain-containing protein [Gilvimarinus sp. SDUM040013]MDX6847814.1 cupin-like domain-containing protein [Gilvimarinus sp. SDUM040013]
MSEFKLIPEYSDLSPKQFHEEIVPQQKPIVMRGFAASWPVVEAARKSSRDFVKYLNRFYNGSKATVLLGHPNINGNFFYNNDCTDLNYIQGDERLDLYLGRLLELAQKDVYPAVSVQSISPENILPGLAEENVTDFFTETLPRLWIGNQTVVSAHFDSSDNVACAIAGRRRFVLFPPDQTGNLYPGSLNFTPAGVPVSMVDLHNPDFDRYPRFQSALDSAFAVELEPGDAVFIPMLWWHHVDALEKVNALMNYWWNGAFAKNPVSPKPIDALNMALLSMQDLSPIQRSAWREVFDHYLFKKNVDPNSYIPEQCQYAIGKITPEAERKLKDDIIQRLQA